MPPPRTTAARELLHDVLRAVGMSVRRYTPGNVPDAQVQALLAHHRVDLVLDVGANEGQYARSLRKAGYTGRVLSFEPLQDAWERCATIAAADHAWSLAPRMALGRSEREVEINVAGNSVSSSVLAMEDKHREAAPGSQYVATQSVPMRRLDGVARAEIDEARRPYLKVDTQGYEREVLAGAEGVMHRICGVQLEMSLTPLYEGSPSLRDLLEMMDGWGFTPWALLPGFIDPVSSRTLQVDGVFFRDEPSAGMAPAT